MTADDITKVISDSLNQDVEHFRALALEASEAGDHKKCNEHLEKQKVAIEELIQLVDAYHASQD